MVTLVVLCQHDSGIEKDHRKVVPDHHPLTRDEIAELLKMAKGLNIVTQNDEFNKIQMRLNQGVMGMTCPPPTYGDVADKMFAMRRIFRKRFAEGPTVDMIDAFDSLLNWHEGELDE